MDTQDLKDKFYFALKMFIKEPSKSSANKLKVCSANASYWNCVRVEDILRADQLVKGY